MNDHREATGKVLLNAVLQNRVLVILLATVILSAALVPGFLELSTFRLSIDRMAAMALVAIGLTVVLLAGQLDLSGGATLALTGIATIALQPALGVAGAAFAGILLGCLVGVLNGVLVVILEINSLVATLASMIFIRGLCHWVTNSRPISGEDPLSGLWLTRPVAGTLTMRTLIFLVIILILHVWITRTVAGRNLLAVGSNADGAVASGIRAPWYTFSTFVFSGLMAGVAGVIQSLAVNTGSAVFGDRIVLLAIAAVVVGGTRLEGGRGSALGTLGGLLTMAALTTAMEYANAPAYVQDIVTGTMLLLLILLDRFGTGRTRGTVISLFRRTPSTVTNRE